MDMVNKQSNSIQNECAKDYLESLKMEKAQPMNLSENNINTYTYSNLEKTRVQENSRRKRPEMMSILVLSL